jgi:hypothetical protein
MNHSEQVAKKVIESLLPESSMSFRVHQSKGECDFALLQNHIPVGEVEVTMLTDASMRQTRARILNVKQGGQFVQGSKCKKGWSIELREGADDIKKIRKLVDDYLAPIETSGVERFCFYMDADTSPAICKIFHDLGVEAGWITKWNSPENRICINSPSLGGKVETTVATDAIIAEANKADNMKKLGQASQVLERHLFVYVDPRCFLPWKILVDTTVIEGVGVPSLPHEITHIWAASETFRAADEFIVWAAKSGCAWELPRRCAVP